MQTRLPEHDHCKFCGDPVPFDRAYCTEDCYWKDQARMKKEKKNNILFVLITGASVLVIMAVSILL
jgi:predicted nucleic acid-binding Zn ribbon protein